MIARLPARASAHGLLGFQQVDTIEAWVPLFLFSVLFGLSMDYQVFLLSRIKERYDQTGDTTRGGRLRRRLDRRHHHRRGADHRRASSAASRRGDLVMFQQMGFGLAVALLHRRDDRPVGARAGRDGAARRAGTGTCRAGSSGCPGSRSRRIARSMYQCQAREAEWTCGGRGPGRRVGQALVARSCSSWRSSIRRILPVSVFGSSSTNSISRGYAYAERRPRT